MLTMNQHLKVILGGLDPEEKGEKVGWDDGLDFSCNFEKRSSLFLIDRDGCIDKSDQIEERRSDFCTSWKVPPLLIHAFSPMHSIDTFKIKSKDQNLRLSWWAPDALKYYQEPDMMHILLWFWSALFQEWFKKGRNIEN